MSNFTRLPAFRSDIEALRGLAVFLVLLFHFNVKGFDGGFIGVDIFFVISGYLITNIIVSAKIQKRFVYFQFWAGRIRRLFPALFFTVLATFAIGAFLLSPYDLKKLANSTLSSLGSFSNIQYWAESGYFDEGARAKPLLHTWSLAVEMQFYLLWPCILALVVRSSGPVRWLILSILCVCPILFSELWFGIDASAPFYLTHFRIGEFVIGAAINWCRLPSRSLLTDAIWLLGVFLIACSLLSLNSEVSFPGLWSLPVAAGTALLIWAMPLSSFRVLIDNWILSALGRVSYSVYLVHWPLYVFLFGNLGLSPNLSEQFALVIMSISIGIAMYYIIERPFRRAAGSKVSSDANREFVKTAIVLSVPLIIVVVSASQSGWEWRWQKSPTIISLNRSLEESRIDYQNNYNLNFPNEDEIKFNMAKHDRYTCSFDLYGYHELVEKCLLTKLKNPSILVIGDSHGRDVFHALRYAYPNINFVMLHQSSCVPAEYDIKNKKVCFSHLVRLLTKIAKTSQVRVVVFASRFQYDKLEVIDEQIFKLSSLFSKSVIIGPGPWLLAEPQKILPGLGDAQDINHINISLTAKMRDSVFESSKVLQNIAERYNINYVRKIDAFCNYLHCKFVDNPQTTPFFFDDQHLTRAGITYLARWFSGNQILKQIFQLY